MNLVPKSGYRGDTRDQDTLLDHDGGFVPIYLLEGHAGGFDGFLDCKNKTAGQMGCHCPGTSEVELFNRARTKFLSVLERPGDVQGHVMFNTGGYLSTAFAHDDAYGGHQYRFDVRCYEYTVAQAAARFHVNAKIIPLVKDFRFYIDTVNLGQASILAVTPRGGVELTFISPLKSQYLTYSGYEA